MSVSPIYEFRERMYSIIDRGSSVSLGLPGIPLGKYFVAGYNKHYAFLVVSDLENGETLFEGRVEVELKLSGLDGCCKEAKDVSLKKLIYDSYNNLLKYGIKHYGHVPSFMLMEDVTDKLKYSGY